MATMNLEIPDAQLNRIVDNFSEYHGYKTEIRNPDYDPADPESLETLPNPQTRIQFVKTKVIKFIKDSVKENETAAAINAAKVTITDVDLA